MARNIVINRKAPVNLNLEDAFLFSHEMQITAPKPKVHCGYWGCFDIHIFASYGHKIDKQMGVFEQRTFHWRLLFSTKLVIGYTVVFDLWSANYFHWLTEVLPKLLFLIEKKQITTILIPASLYKKEFVHQSLKILPNEIKVKIISAPHRYFLPVYKYCSLGVHSGNFHPDIICQLREKMWNAFFATSEQVEQQKEIIFIYRNLSERRGIVNFSEVEVVLAQKNVKVVNFSVLTFREQIVLMRRCAMLIGVHGAGLTNMLFTNPGTRILELRKKGDAHNNCYFSLASALGLPYYYLQCEVDSAEKLTQECNFIVDVNQFSDCLSRIFQNS